ncbi:MAG: hypothetical protein K6T91_10630 [Firmicutes bacterium]|nr:hypothetical protein [Bacillota bacterium]
MGQTLILRLVLMLTAIFVITLPFGYWRAGAERLSRDWFLAIHIPVPIVILLRLGFHFGWWALLFTIPAFAAGQYAGARSRSLLSKRA